MPTGGGGVLVPPSHRPITSNKEEKKMSKKLELVRADYQGMQVSFTEEGWFNATEVAEKFGKRPVDWLNLDSTREYIHALCDILKCEDSSHLKTRRGNQGGTWISPDLVVVFARWLDVKFAIWCDQQIKILISGKHPHFDWKRLRHEATSSFKVMNDILKDVRAEIGKATLSHHYSNEAKLINWALTGQFGGLDREALSINELDILAKMEEKNTVLIGRGVEYRTRKDILEQYAIDLRPAPLDASQVNLLSPKDF
jgi:hypothetical protein